MALYIPHSIFRLARLLYVRPETFGPYYVYIEIIAVFVRTLLTINMLSKAKFRVLAAHLDGTYCYHYV